MIEEDQVKNMALVQEIERLIDIKREKEFDVQMIDQASESRVKRLEKQLKGLQIDIDLVKIMQEKIKKQSK